MNETYAAEEFAQKLKLRGYVRYIDDARKYVKKTGKQSFTEDDFYAAYCTLDGAWPEYGEIYSTEKDSPYCRKRMAYQQRTANRL